MASAANTTTCSDGNSAARSMRGGTSTRLSTHCCAARAGVLSTRQTAPTSLTWFVGSLCRPSTSPIRSTRAMPFPILSRSSGGMHSPGRHRGRRRCPCLRSLRPTLQRRRPRHRCPRCRRPCRCRRIHLQLLRHRRPHHRRLRHRRCRHPRRRCPCHHRSPHHHRGHRRRRRSRRRHRACRRSLSRKVPTAY